jgi:hypothetical protein
MRLRLIRGLVETMFKVDGMRAVSVPGLMFSYVLEVIHPYVYPQVLVDRISNVSRPHSLDCPIISIGTNGTSKTAARYNFTESVNISTFRQS